MSLPLVFLVRMLWLNLHPIYGGRAEGRFPVHKTLNQLISQDQEVLCLATKATCDGLLQSWLEKQAFWNAEMPNTMEKCSDP